MSSFTRRGCFKCGNVGHSAADCESASRLCYNCRSADHESSSCPHPRTTEARQCYSCGGVGHISATCPSQQQNRGGPGGFRGPPGGAGLGGPKCYNCGGPGHLARLCPSPPGTGAALQQQGGFAHNPTGGNFGGGFRSQPMGGFGGGFPRAPGGFGGPRVNLAAVGTKCYRCNGDNHFARDCPTPAGLVSGGVPKPKTCYKCQETGHIARECPTNEAAPDATTPAPVAAASAITSPPKATEASLVPAAAEVHV
ncbi:hypothetical protein BDY24DRAFT_370817 [Mrakia frigida]|uniref:uncharacterized protein n=1 Tax=Mrakia frigida TaxID=29902 RepID=UPI003FCC02D3